MMDSLTLWIGERLAIGSLQGAVVIAVVWLACRFVPRIPAAAQSMLWWLVALKLVLTFAPVPALPVPLLPADFEQQTEQVLLQPMPQIGEAGAARSTLSILASLISSWLWAVILFWFVILLAQAGRLVHAHRALRGIVRRSVVWPDEDIAALAGRLGLTRAPELRVSDEIDTPQVCGLRSPVVLMPTEAMTTFTADERRMTLCHELMHIRRRDLALGWVPACAERLFFFHPLARLAAREYVAAREAACDAAAIRALDVSVTDYGRMLIRLGIGNAGPALAVGASPFSPSSLKRRLHMLEFNGTPRLSRRWRWAIAVAAVAVIPLQLVARTPAPPQTVTLQKAPKSIAFSADRNGREVYVAELDQTTGKVVKLQELKKKVVVVEKSKPSFDLYMLFKTLLFARESQNAQAAAEQARDAEARARAEAELKRAQAEEARAAAQVRDAETFARAGAELRATLEKAKLSSRLANAQARAAEQQVDRARFAEMLARLQEQVKDRANAKQLEELRGREQTLKAYFEKAIQQKGQPQVTIDSEQLRQLAERYQQLAAEARRLADEFERLQRQAVQPK